MNIPEINNEIKQELRSENPAQAQAVDTPRVHKADTPAQTDAVQRFDNAKKDTQSGNFSKKNLNSLAAEVQEHLETNNVKLKFNVLEEADTVQVEIIDNDGKTIRKIPGDDLLKLSKSLKNLGQGFLNEVF